jgi:hypothetical protein
LADIQREFFLLYRIESVLDELNAMAMLFNDQRNVLKVMDGIVKFISALERQIRAVKWQTRKASRTVSATQVRTQEKLEK